MKHKLLYSLMAALILLSVIGFTTRSAIAKPSASVQAATNISYTVQYGDTLNKIAAKYCTNWQAIYNLNYGVIGSNPNRIYPGMVLTVPANCNTGGNPPPTTTPPPGGVYDRGPITHATGTFTSPNYRVAPGDWLAYIGQRFGVPWQNIYSANHLTSTVIYAGQVLFIPGTGGTPPPTATPPPSGNPERVNFSTGAISATRTGTISSGVPKGYVLGAMAGQTMYVSGASHAEALTVTIKNYAGQQLAVTGTNGAVNFSVQAYLPITGDYYVTFTPVTTPASPSLAFDVTFTIP